MSTHKSGLTRLVASRTSKILDSKLYFTKQFNEHWVGKMLLKISLAPFGLFVIVIGNRKENFDMNGQICFYVQNLFMISHTND